MNLCKFAPMIASLITFVTRFLREITNTLLSKAGLFRVSGKAFLRFGALATIAMLAWAGVDAQMVSTVAPTGEVTIAMELGMGENVYAATEPNTPTGDALIKTINLLFNALYAIMTPFLMLAGWLMTPDWVFGEIFGLRPVLHNMWIMVSNIVYVIFAFLLVAMAFMNIFGAEGNTWAIKAKLPKLIVGIISVPFTWFFVSAIVSISSVLTASAVQLAGDLAPSDLNQFTITIPTTCNIDFTKSVAGGTTPSADGKTPSSTSTGKFLDCGTNEKETTIGAMTKSNDAFGIVSYYAYGVFKIQDYKSITALNISSVKNILDLGMNMIIALIMFAVFSFIIIMLVFSLLTRALYFWAIAVFSPLLSLRYFFEGKLGFGDSWLSVTNIISLAMVPVYVAAALSFGLIFTSLVTTTTFQGVKESPYISTEGSTEKVQKIVAFGTTYNVTGVPVGTSTYKDAKAVGGGFIGQLIMQIAALCILWFAVTAALKGSEITKQAAAPIENFGNEIGKLTMSLPKYAPIIPTPHGSASLASLPTALSTVSNAIRGQASTRGTEIGGRLNDALGINNELSKKTSAALVNIASRQDPVTPDQHIAMMKDATKIANTTTDKVELPQQKQVFTAVVNKSKLSKEEKEKLITEIKNLKGNRDSVSAFLKNYSHAVGDNSHTFDTAEELDEHVKGHGSGGQTTSSQSVPNAKQINITNNTPGQPPIPVNLNFEKEGAEKTLDKGTLDELKKQIDTLKDINGKNDTTRKADKDRLDKLATDIKTALEENGVIGVDMHKKIRTAIGLND